jgi:hypothetical protein
MQQLTRSCSLLFFSSPMRDLSIAGSLDTLGSDRVEAERPSRTRGGRHCLSCEFRGGWLSASGQGAARCETAASLCQPLPPDGREPYTSGPHQPLRSSTVAGLSPRATFRPELAQGANDVDSRLDMRKGRAIRPPFSSGAALSVRRQQEIVRCVPEPKVVVQ